MVSTLDLRLQGCEFNSQLGCYQVVTTWMGDFKWVSTSQYITNINTKVNSAFHPSEGRYIKYRPVWLGLWQDMFKCWMARFLQTATPFNQYSQSSLFFSHLHLFFAALCVSFQY